MDLKIASTLVVAALAEGAELRMKIGREIGPTIVKAAELIANCLQSGNKLLLFENGGSAADAQHLAAEFVGRFAMERVGLPAIGLTTDSSILTAVGNGTSFGASTPAGPSQRCRDRHQHKRQFSKRPCRSKTSVETKPQNNRTDRQRRGSSCERC